MPLTNYILLLLFALAGIDLKLADFYGRKHISYIFAVISAISMGLLISDSPSSSSIVLGIILGVSLTGKVDQPSLVMGLGLTLATSIIVGFTMPNFSLLAVITVTTLIDEIGHDRITSGNILANFFRFRMTLKTIIIILAALTQVDVIHAAGFFSFDLSYDVVSVFIPLLKRI